MKRFLLQILHFSRAERAGTIALLIICGLVYLAPEIMHWLRPETTTDFTQFQADVQAFRSGMTVDKTAASGQKGELFEFDPNTASQEDFMRLGLSEKVAGVICNYRNKGGHFRKPEDLKKIYSLATADFERLEPWIQIGGIPDRSVAEKQAAPTTAAESFAFDPNLVSETDLQRLGLPARTIKGIMNYRSKGGKFRKPEDFGKIYSLEEEDFDRLQPFINIGVIAGSSIERPAAFVGGATFPEKKWAVKGPVDINRAGLDDWLRLPGIGEKRARQLVNFRESLGGFLRVEQVAEMYGLPDSVFQKIRSMLTLESNSIHHININAASVEELDRHPYISFKQATLIVNYRTQHGSYAKPEEISQIVAFTDKNWLEKIRPYLAVQ